MAKYRIKRDHFLHDRALGLPPQFHRAGAVIEWPGVPSRFMEPLDEAARAALSLTEKARRGPVGRNPKTGLTVWGGERPL